VNPASIADICQLCGLPAAHLGMAGDASFTFEIDCERCGKYRISHQAVEVLPADKKYLLSYICRTWSERDPPKILTVLRCDGGEQSLPESTV
jgi:hypothetical protein